MSRCGPRKTSCCNGCYDVCNPGRKTYLPPRIPRCPISFDYYDDYTYDDYLYDKYRRSLYIMAAPVPPINPEPPTTSVSTPELDPTQVKVTDNEDVVCKICVENKITHALIPCGHTFCANCISSLKQKTPKECPFCRKSVDFEKNVLTLFI